MVQVPQELGNFVSDPHFHQVLLRVKEQSNINTISVHRNADKTAASILIDAPSQEGAMLARKLIEMHFKQQLKIIAAESRLQKVQMDLFSAQGEMASGLRMEFTVKPHLLGIIIGKGGARIKAVEKSAGVEVNVDDSGKNCIFCFCFFFFFLLFMSTILFRSNSCNGTRRGLSAGCP